MLSHSVFVDTASFLRKQWISINCGHAETQVVQCADTKAGISMKAPCYTGGVCLQQASHSRTEDVVLFVSSQKLHGTVTKHTLFRTHQHASCVC